MLRAIGGLHPNDSGVEKPEVSEPALGMVLPRRRPQWGADTDSRLVAWFNRST